MNKEKDLIDKDKDLKAKEKKEKKSVDENLNSKINSKDFDLSEINENIIFKKRDNKLSSQDDKDVILKKIELSTQRLIKKLSILFPSILSKSKVEDNKFIKEYYDLNEKYNITNVRIIPQTPNRLFVLWEISQNYMAKITSEYGQNFWESTYPVLIVRNLFDDSSFEVEINDYTNSWYIDVPDSESKYEVTLARRIKSDIKPINSLVNSPVLTTGNLFIFLTSNIVETPNNKILFNSLNNTHLININTNEEVDLRTIKNTNYKQMYQKMYNFNESELKNIESSR